MSERWNEGDVIALRFFPRGRLLWMLPVRVVEDSDEQIVLFLDAGTVIKKPVDPETGEEISRRLRYRARFDVQWVLGNAVWRENSVLMVARPGQARSHWAFWTAHDWTFHAWYVNLQAPLARSNVGFDTEDHVLDVVIEPDLATWEWKDEEELADAVRVGRFTAADADQIRAEGMRAVQALNAREWPFNDAWSSWRPDPSWPLPTLQPDWEESPMSKALVVRGL
jgi:hypothetical protein